MAAWGGMGWWEQWVSGSCGGESRTILKHQEKVFLSFSTINAWQPLLVLHQTSSGGK